jgi:hypothetical protein
MAGMAVVRSMLEELESTSVTETCVSASDDGWTVSTVVCYIHLFHLSPFHCHHCWLENASFDKVLNNTNNKMGHSTTITRGRGIT